ncbi:MAG: hypothetical protein ACR2MP_10550 [Streptosporangiaceae bacterium]
MFFAVSALACWYIAYKDIRLSSILTLVLECLSVLCILSVAVVACIFSLVGFESATALGGEAKNPLRNVPPRGDLEPYPDRPVNGDHGYAEVFGTRQHGAPLSSIAAPLNVISHIYVVSYFRIPLSPGAMISFSRSRSPA